MTLWYLNNFWPLETRFTNPATKWVRRLWCSPLIDQMVSQWCRSEATTNREEKISVLPEFFPPPPPNIILGSFLFLQGPIEWRVDV